MGEQRKTTFIKVCFLVAFIVSYKIQAILSLDKKMATFEEACDNMNNKVTNVSNDESLELYALFKQATVGDCNKEEPGSWDLAGKMKWNAWIGKKGMSQDEAKAEYVKVAD